MHYKALLFIIVLLVGGFFYLHTVNPGDVNFVVGKGYEYVVPVTYLVLAGFIAGVVLTVINSLFVDLRRALKDYRHSREHKKHDNTEANYRSGVSALLKGDTERAKKFLIKAVDSEPGDSDLHIRLAETYLAENNPQEALNILDKGLARLPESTDLLLKAVAVAKEAKDERKLERTLNEILSLDPGNPTALKDLRELSVARGELDQAVELQKKLVSAIKKGDDPALEASLLTGLLYEDAVKLLNDGAFDDASQRLKELLKRERDFVPAHILQGEIFYRQGNLSSALRAWERGYEDLRDPVFFLRIEDVYLEQSEPEKLLEKFKDAVFKSPQDVDLGLLLSRLYLRLEMVDEAVSELERIRDDVEESYYLELLLGEAYLRRGHGEKAAMLFESALSIDKALPPSFSCSSCETGSDRWLASCPACERWNTLKLSRTTSVARESVPEKFTNVSLQR